MPACCGSLREPLATLEQHSAAVRYSIGELRSRAIAHRVGRHVTLAALVVAPIAVALAYAGSRGVAALVTGVALAAVATRAARRAPSRAQVAQIIDRATGANDLIVTAAAIADGRQRGGRFARWLMADAADRVAAVRNAEVVSRAPVAVAAVAALVTVVAPALVTPPAALLLSVRSGQGDEATTSTVRERDLRPGRGEVVRRNPRRRHRGDIAAHAERPRPQDQVAFNPRIPGHNPGHSKAPTADTAPTAGMGRGAGTIGGDRRGQLRLPFSLRAVASEAVVVHARRGSGVPVSTAVPADYRAIVARYLTGETP